MRITELKKLFTKEIHFTGWAKKATLQHQIAYCSKEGPLTSYGLTASDYPEEVYQGEDLPTQLYDWQNDIITIISTKADDRTIHWFWENTGNVGKTTFTKYLAYHFNALVCQKGNYGDIMNHAFNKTNLKIFVIDVPRSSGNSVSYTAIESIKSGLIINNKYETGSKIILSPHIIIFANAPPDTSKLSLDRWNIINISNDTESIHSEDSLEGLRLCSSFRTHR